MRHSHRIRTRMAGAEITSDHTTSSAGGPWCGVCDRALPSQRCGEDLSVGSHSGVLAGIVGDVVGMCLSMTAEIAKGPLSWGGAIVDHADPSVADVLARLAAIIGAFERTCHQILQAIIHQRLPTPLCPLADSRVPAQVLPCIAITALDDTRDRRHGRSLTPTP